MKLQGSKIVKLHCFDCGMESLPFRIFLCEDDGILQWDSTKIPPEWEIGDEAEYESSLGVIFGICPKCR